MQSEPRNARISVWALPISLAATFGIDVSFSSSGYLDVSVHRVPSVYLWIQYTVTEGFSVGFPHSDISGSLDMCSSPKLFAAYHVFHRLSVPRHPPCALSCLSLSLGNSFTGVSLKSPRSVEAGIGFVSCVYICCSSILKINVLGCLYFLIF